MKAYTRRRLIASAKLGLAAIPFSILLTVAQDQPIVPGTFLLAFAAGFCVGIAELFLFKVWLRGLPFFPHLLLKSLLIVAVMYFAFALLNTLDVIIDGITWKRYAEVLVSSSVLIGIGEGFVIVVLLLFFVHLDRLLGPGVLAGYVTGKYHRPRREERIFMFLDLRGSTSLAEEMRPETYYRFLHRYFAEMSEPILATNAEIYQYVGDEVVLTWKMRSGLEEANCVRLFFLVKQHINSHRDHFLRDYNAIPEFKAGVHCGDVITAQIGELKSEVVYNGDVLNTTARIQSMCNDLGQDLIVSEELVKMLPESREFSFKPLGPIRLRGKSEGIALYGVSEHRN